MAPLALNHTSSTLAVTRLVVQNNIFEFSPDQDSQSPSPFAVHSSWLGCVYWSPIQKSALFQLANVCFFIAYVTPTGAYGSLFLHSTIVLGYLLYATWAWNVVCAPSIFTWAFVFVILNIGQILRTLYQMRTARFLPDLEALYMKLFQPFQVSRKEFSKITSADHAHMVTLYSGDAYAVENITRTDRLGLLMRGRMRVSHQSRPLHCVFAHEFLDSAEFHSSTSLTTRNRFTVTVTALTECEILIWERADIEYLMAKYPYVRTIMESLVAKDILLKLMILGNQISGWRWHQPCDLRLAQKKSFVTALRARSVSAGLVTADEDSVQNQSSDDDVASPETDRRREVAPPSIRKSPLSLPYSANIELAQWYHAFLKRELICDAAPSSLVGASRLSVNAV